MTNEDELDPPPAVLKRKDETYPARENVHRRPNAPMNQARARLTELAQAVRAGNEKIITLNGESYVALVDARRLDHYHRLEREHIHLTLLDEAAKGWEDVEQGRTLSVAQAKTKYKVSKKR